MNKNKETSTVECPDEFDLYNNRRKHRRQRFSILNANAINNEKVQQVDILRNGFTYKTKSRSETVSNTFPVNSIIYFYIIFEVDYSGKQNYDDLSQLISLVIKKSYQKALVKRNNIVFSMFPNRVTISENNVKTLNLYGGIGDMFEKMCERYKNLCSFCCK